MEQSHHNHKITTMIDFKNRYLIMNILMIYLEINLRHMMKIFDLFYGLIYI